MYDQDGCPAAADEEPQPMSWWLRGLIATASALTGAIMPLPEEPREAWSCPFCSWESAAGSGLNSV